MEQKSYGQMRQEFVQLYQNEVKDALPEYNKRRKEGFPKFIVFTSIWFTFLSIFSLLALSAFIKESFLFIGLSLLPVLVIEVIILIFLTRNDEKKYDGRGGYTVEIQTGFEKKLKAKFMNKFLNIFFSECSYGGVLTELIQGKYSDTVKIIREQKILNPFPFIGFDEIIVGLRGDVKIKIYESDTRVFTIGTLMLGTFLVVFFSFMLTPYTLDITFFVKILIITAILFIKKIYQYSPFRGVIVEFEMNKPFKGHTFFHDKSFTAKKIPFNKKIYQRVNLESVSFEKKYNVYSDDQIEARYILTTSVMERIENINTVFRGKYIRGSFKNNRLYIAIHTGKDMFAMGSDSKDTNSKTFEILYDEIISILKMADELKLNQHIGL